jgi:hypothetical protein
MSADVPFAVTGASTGLSTSFEISDLAALCGIRTKNRGEAIAGSFRRPTQAPLYQVVQHHLATFLARASTADPMGHGLAEWVERDFRGCLECRILVPGLRRRRVRPCSRDSRRRHDHVRHYRARLEPIGEESWAGRVGEDGGTAHAGTEPELQPHAEADPQATE